MTLTVSLLAIAAVTDAGVRAKIVKDETWSQAIVSRDSAMTMMVHGVHLGRVGGGEAMPDLQYDFELPTFNSLDGGAGVFFADLTQEVEERAFGGGGSLGMLQEVKATLWKTRDSRGTTGSHVQVLVNHAPFLAVEFCVDSMGAYPSTTCAQHRKRLDTKAGWAWVDAIAPTKRTAFLAECSRRVVGRLTDVQKGGTTESELAQHKQLWPELYPTQCTEATLEDATVTPAGELVVRFGQGLPHAAQALRWATTFSRAQFGPFVDPLGPLGVWVPPGTPVR